MTKQEIITALEESRGQLAAALAACHWLYVAQLELAGVAVVLAERMKRALEDRMELLDAVKGLDDDPDPADWWRNGPKEEPDRLLRQGGEGTAERTWRYRTGARQKH